MEEGRGGTARTHIRDLMCGVALVAVVLYPASVFKDASLCFYVSALSLFLPWGVLGWVRAATPPGPYWDWVVTPVLYCAPLALTTGLFRYAETLGLDPGYHGHSLLPACLLAGFAVVFVGPWLCAFAAWDFWKRRPRRGRAWGPGMPGSSIARLMAAVAAVSLGLTACRSPEVFVAGVFLLNAGCFVAFVIREHQTQKPPGPRAKGWPREEGYVPRADGDDPFA
ncbi:MAG: hypothetical protein LC745_00600 [Planctomycetia bacterium]|nr:hypothetical protein [Planctomycetia bacterium]